MVFVAIVADTAEGITALGVKIGLREQVGMVIEIEIVTTIKQPQSARLLYSIGRYHKT